LNTPSGKPASCQSFAIQMAALGSFSEGFKITVLPVAMAIGKNHIGTIGWEVEGANHANHAKRLRVE
jgi:hypothetical protein